MLGIFSIISEVESGLEGCGPAHSALSPFVIWFRIYRAAGFLEDQDKLVGFVHAENRRIAKRAHVVVFVPAIPDNDVVVDEANIAHEVGDVAVKWVKRAFFS